MGTKPKQTQITLTDTEVGYICHILMDVKYAQYPELRNIARLLVNHFGVQKDDRGLLEQ